MSTPLVAIVMGSDSDWPVMSAAKDVLDEFGVASDVQVPLALWLSRGNAPRVVVLLWNLLGLALLLTITTAD